MTLRDRVFAGFHYAATGTLRLDLESADEFASHIANANEAIHVVGQLCSGANSLKSETLAVMLECWLKLLPGYESPRRVLMNWKGQLAATPQIAQVTGLSLRSRVFEVC
jgi:hypothetical protein